MKPKKIKTKRYWRMPQGMKLYGTKNIAQYYSGFAAAEVAPVVVLPADAASVERMVEQMARAIAETNTSAGKEVMVMPCDAFIASAALAAIGIGGAK